MQAICVLGGSQPSPELFSVLVFSGDFHLTHYEGVKLVAGDLRTSPGKAIDGVPCKTHGQVGLAEPSPMNLDERQPRHHRCTAALPGAELMISASESVRYGPKAITGFLVGGKS